MASFKNDLILIETPKGAIIQREYTKGKNKGQVYLRIEWNPNFAPSYRWAWQKVQAELDQEIIRLVSPYVPRDTGILESSALLASDIGSGWIEHATPYAAVQFYDTAESRPYDPLRGSQWGPRMKADKLPQIENFVRKRVKAHVGNR